MNHKPPRTREAVLVILRDILIRLEHSAAPENDTATHTEFERVLRVRIATLEAESSALHRLINFRGTHSS
jgi:hypothetical protein